MAGAILLHRRLLESFAFANETTLKIWIYLLLKAKYKRGYFDIDIGKGKKTIELQRGQLIFGRLKASEKLGIPASTIERHLENLKEKKQISIKKTSHYSIISIKNYNDYQQDISNSEPPMNHQRATDEPPMNTYNNVNKVNKDNNITLSSENEIYGKEKRGDSEQNNSPFDKSDFGNAPGTIDQQEDTLQTGNNSGQDGRSSLPDLRNSNLYRQPNIPKIEKVHETFVFQGGTKEQADRFFEMLSSVGWYYKSSPVVDFTFLVPKFIAAWNKNLVQNDKFKNNANTSNTNNSGRRLSKHEAGLAGSIEDLKEHLNYGGVPDM